MREAIAEIHRVLKASGLTVLTFLSKHSSRYGCGEEIEPETFIPTIGPDAGIPHHYSDREELEDLLAKFAILKIELVDSHGEVLAEKR